MTPEVFCQDFGGCFKSIAVGILFITSAVFIINEHCHKMKVSSEKIYDYPQITP